MVPTMSDLCPVCRNPVIVTDGGETLDAQADLLGIFHADGTKLSGAQIARAVRTKTPTGHQPHECPEPEQDGLFDAGPGAVTRQGRR